MPSRGCLNIRVEKEQCGGWDDVLDALLAAITCAGLESWQAEIGGIAASLDEAEKSNHDAIGEERSRLQREIERLQLQIAALGNGS